MPDEAPKKICGIVMPISAIDGCDESHWSDVIDIISEAIEHVGFEPNLVSNADDVGIIHKRIIQNLYDNPIVVCDVSGKNPNVMFELGLRLAFDKPTIIIKDDKTTYSFDTSAIEHLEYPRDLRFSRIVEFKQKLGEKIRATHEKATSDANYTTFLKHFGEFKVAKLDKKEVSGQEFILEELKSIRTVMRRLEGVQKDSTIVRNRNPPVSGDVNLCLEGRSDSYVEEVRRELAIHPGVLEVILDDRGPRHKHVIANVDSNTDKNVIETKFNRRIAVGRVVKKGGAIPD